MKGTHRKKDQPDLIYKLDLVQMVRSRLLKYPPDEEFIEAIEYLLERPVAEDDRRS